LPTAYFVNGDTGLKQTTDVAWGNKYLNAEEVAVIVPIPEAVLDDTSFDVWASIKPLLAEAAGRVIDGAIFLGINKPGSWPADLKTAATAAGNTYERGTSTQALGGVAQDLSNLMGLVEADGFDVNGIVANRIYRGLLRTQRATTGQTLPEVSSTEAYGVPITYPMRGMFTTAAEAFVGDFSQGIIGIRQDWTYKVLDQAVIQDTAGVIVYNLAQQDMVALRLVGRFAWEVANVINYDQPTAANRYPFGVMTNLV
jgi:HK97 family phage major capsid protein